MVPAILGILLCVVVLFIFIYGTRVQQARMLRRLEVLEGRGAGSTPTTRELPGPRPPGFDRLPSLFIVSLPRSFSSIAYVVARSALCLREAAFTTEGEILNYDRYTDYATVGEHVWRRFTRKELEPNLFYQNRIILDHAVQPRGYVYKDVVQPFVVSDWLPGRELRILHLTRNLADVAFAMMGKGWLYPSHASERVEDKEHALLEGLVLAEEALSGLPAVRADYDDLVTGEEVLWAALARLYPNRELLCIAFMNEQFRSRRAQTLARRETAQFRELEEKIEQVRQRLHAGGARASSPGVCRAAGI